MSEVEKEDEDRVRLTEPMDPDAAVHPAIGLLPEGAASLRVEVVGGPMDGRRTTVAAMTLTIGRDEDNDLALPLDRSVSSRHARIVREEERFWLEDLDSRNGTFLGDRRIRRRTLIGPGTLFTAGRTALEFLLQ